MKRLFLLMCTCIFFIMTPHPSHAEISVKLTLDRHEVTTLDTIRMVVSVSGVRNSTTSPAIKGLHDFNVSNGGTSTQLEIINGRKNAHIDFTYYIEPLKTGTFHIGPAHIKISGKMYTSNNVDLVVRKATASNGKDKGPLFLEAALSSRNSYIEEPLIYTLKLYRRVKVSDISLDLPKTENLNLKQLRKPSEYETFHNEKSYQVLEIRYQLIPSKEGSYTIEPAKMNMTAYTPDRRSSRNSFFDDPFFNLTTGRPATLMSQPVDLKVRPLPEKGKPADFSGLVGKYDIKSTLSPSTIKALTSASFTVTLQGTGNINRMPDLKGPDLSEFKIYEDQPVFTSEPASDGFRGIKIMKWALVPQKEGRFTIPSQSITFFDQEEKTYRMVSTQPLILVVLPGKKDSTADSISEDPQKERNKLVSKKEIVELDRDILPIHTSIAVLSSGSELRTGNLYAWLILTLPMILYAVACFAMRIRAQSVSQQSFIKSRKAARTFVKFCRGDDPTANILMESVRNYVNDRFGLAVGLLTPEEIENILSVQGVHQQTRDKFHSILAKLENAVYTGKGDESCDMKDETIQLIRQVEKEVK